MLSKIKGFTSTLTSVFTKQVASGTPKWKLNGIDCAKVLRNALFTGSSAAILFLINGIAQETLNSVAQGVAIAILNAVVDGVFRYIRNNQGDNDVKE